MSAFRVVMLLYTAAHALRTAPSASYAVTLVFTKSEAALLLACFADKKGKEPREWTGCRGPSVSKCQSQTLPWAVGSGVGAPQGHTRPPALESHSQLVSIAQDSLTPLLLAAPGLSDLYCPKHRYNSLLHSPGPNEQGYAV